MVLALIAFKHEIDVKYWERKVKIHLKFGVDWGCLTDKRTLHTAARSKGYNQNI